MALRRFSRQAARPLLPLASSRLPSTSLYMPRMLNKSNLSNALVAEDPFDPFDLDWPFSDPFFRQPIMRKRNRREWLPAVDVSENDSTITIHAELPGVKPEDLKINITKDSLSIVGEKKYEKKDEKQHRIERSFGRFTRSWSLPENVDADKAEARFKDGVMTISLPKVAPKPPEGAKELPILTE